jgi:hypothetical protein
MNIGVVTSTALPCDFHTLPKLKISLKRFSCSILWIRSEKYVLKQVPRHEEYCGGGLAPRFLDLGTGRRLVLSFTLQRIIFSNVSRYWREVLYEVRRESTSKVVTLAKRNYTHTHKRGRAREGVSKSFRTGRLERELQIVQLFATRCSCIAISWLSLVSFAAITLCVALQRVITKVSIYFVIDSSGNFCIHLRVRYLHNPSNPRTIL